MVLSTSLHLTKSAVGIQVHKSSYSKVVLSSARGGSVETEHLHNRLCSPFHTHDCSLTLELE